MPQTIETVVYSFDELSDKAKETAREWIRGKGYPFDGWHDSVIEWAKEAGEIIGIDISRVYFSGFWPQGDGASFEGTYHYRKGALAALRKDCPNETRLHNIAGELQSIQRRNFYALSAGITQRGNYCHEHNMRVDVEDARDNYGYCRDDSAESDITEAMQDFARWIYATLEREYDWLMSDEQVDDCLWANGYQFTEDGKAW